MGQEIFGPVLPIMTFTELEDVISQLQGKDTPLALYFFSRHRPSIESVTQRIPYGGGCINDTIIHLATTAMGDASMTPSSILPLLLWVSVAWERAAWDHTTVKPDSIPSVT